MFALVNFSAGVTICEGFRLEHGVPWSARRELAAHGVANGAAMLVGSPPIGASLSRSVVQKLAGAATPRAGLFVGLCGVLLLPRVAPMLAPAPKATLAAIVVAAVADGVVYPAFAIGALRERELEGLLVFCATAAGCLAVSPMAGLVGGTALELVIRGARRALAAPAKAD